MASRSLSNSFALYRIIGNDLFPRHKKGQARMNLQFILEHEEDLKDCERIWIVNRIIDKSEENEIFKILNYHNQQFIHIPFIEEEYKKIGWDTDCLPKPGYLASKKIESLGLEQRNRLIAATYRLKNNYIMNNNGARNLALRDGRSRAKWILPWDGNCFVTKNAWDRIQLGVTASPHLKYFVVPMARVVDNNQLLNNDFEPDPVEEPQLIFRSDSLEEFNEEFCYGRRSKVELFWRLGISGKWNSWRNHPWDLMARPKSSEAGQYGVAGWVARLHSGMDSLEKGSKKSFIQRGLVRTQAIINTIRYVDVMISQKSADWNELTFFQIEKLKEEKNSFLSGEILPPITRLLVEANEALKRGPYSVIDKKTLPPSGNPNDYWHPAPYWWPNPKTKDGLPYIRRDGKRVPGTRMYEKDSDKYDRTRLQCVFDDSFTLALAWYFTGEKKYAEHGVRMLERFFVDPVSGMTPHLRYAQVRMGRKKNQGSSTGIIEMKDFYYYLDAVRLFRSAGAITKETLESFKKWLQIYLEWLLQSSQGIKERRAENNHGTYYDLQVATLADFLEEQTVLFETLIRAQSRIAVQFAADGSQPEEMRRKTTAHYCCFNFQGWINLAKIASKWGTDLWSYKAPNGSNLVKGAEWLLSHIGKEWPYKQIEEFDTERFLPILFSMPLQLTRFQVGNSIPQSIYSVKPLFHPHDGVRPYWNLGMPQTTGEQK